MRLGCDSLTILLSLFWKTQSSPKNIAAIDEKHNPQLSPLLDLSGGSGFRS